MDLYLDDEEQVYRRTLLQSLVNIIQMQLNTEKIVMYTCLKTLIEKTEIRYGGLVADQFLNEKGLLMLMKDLSTCEVSKNGEEGDRVQIKALEVTKTLMMDSGACVQLLKLNLLSNLILSVLQSQPSLEPYIQDIL